MTKEELEKQSQSKKQQLTKAKEIMEKLSKSLFLAKGIIRDLIDDTVDFKESKERAIYCYEQEHFDTYKEAVQFLKEEEKIADEEVRSDCVETNLLKRIVELNEKINKIREYLAYDIPLELINEATIKIMRMIWDMNRIRCLTSKELLKYFRDKTPFYPVGFSSKEQYKFMIETIEIDHKTNMIELTLVSLYPTFYPIRHRVNQFELLQNWCFADGFPCGTLKKIEEMQNIK